MTVFQKLSPVGGGESAAQNYGRADQLRGLEAFIILIAGVGLVLLSFTYHSSTAFVAWMLLMAAPASLTGSTDTSSTLTSTTQNTIGTAMELASHSPRLGCARPARSS